MHPSSSHTETNAATREALQGIEETFAGFAAWQDGLASIAVRIERPFTDGERRAMLDHCTSIESELLAARTAILLNLADASARVRGHSRVVDVEKAMDAIETRAREITRRLVVVSA